MEFIVTVTVTVTADSQKKAEQRCGLLKMQARNLDKYSQIKVEPKN